MAFMSGHGGSMTGPSFAADVRRWEITYEAQLHDTTVLGQADGRVIPGILDWTLNCEAFIDGGLATEGQLKPGTGVQTIVLKYNSAATNADRLVIDGATASPVQTICGYVETSSIRTDINNAISANITIRANGVFVLQKIQSDSTP